MNLKHMKMNGPGGVHALAFIGGGLTVVGAGLILVFSVFKLSLLHIFFSSMMILFGLVTVLLEQQQVT